LLIAAGKNHSSIDIQRGYLNTESNKYQIMVHQKAEKDDGDERVLRKSAQVITFFFNGLLSAAVSCACAG
jgi:hypothetical protein